MDAADGISGAHERLVSILEIARTNDESHVEVFSLDALARVAAEHGDIDEACALSELADRRMEAVSHFITERDRIDAHIARQREQSAAPP
jgi:hypothetical protein